MFSTASRHVLFSVAHAWRRRAGRVALALLAVGGAARATAQEAADNREVQTRVRAVGEVWENVTGGLDRGAWWNLLVHADVTVPGARLGAPESSRFVAQVHWVQNRDNDTSFTDKTGTFNPVSGAFASDHVRVYNLYYAQEFAGGRGTFKVGQIALDDDFMLSDLAALFTNAAFGPMPSAVGTALLTREGEQPAFPIYPVAAPGLYLGFAPGERWSWHVGLYYGAPGNDERRNHGFRWGERDGAGVSGVAELILESRVLGRELISKWGVTGHTGRVADLEAAQAGATDQARRGLASIYTVQDWLVAMDEAGEPKLGLFARLGFAPRHERNAVSFYTDGGLNWFGPLPARPRDVLGVGVSQTTFGKSFRRLNGLARRETTLELTYVCAATDRVTVQGDVQWLLGAQRDRGGHGTATAVGVRTSVTW